MARIVFDFFSKSLRKATTINVILPDADEIPENGWKVIYLLHGWSDDHTAWTRYTSIERYAMKRNLAVVMPDAEFSFYNDMVNGGQYMTYITEELPQVCSKYFRISTKREDNFIGGLSMGGCGSMTVGLSHPELYSGIICLSAANFPVHAFPGQAKVMTPDRWPGWRDTMDRIYGDIFPNLEGTKYDFYMSIDKIVKEGGPFPTVFQYMGLEEIPAMDWAKKDQEKFLSVEGNPFNYKLVTYHGIHTWDSWDAHIEEALDHLGLTVCAKAR